MILITNNKKPFLYTVKILSIYYYPFSKNSLTLRKSQDHDSVFIRHAHSQFNHACQQYRIKNKIDYNWQKLVSHQNFSNQVGFNPKYIDCSLTQKGVQQCYKTSKHLNLSQFQYIMVSPHKRALQTLNYIIQFSNIKNKVPVIVQPLIAGSLWSACDVGDNVQKKVKQFPHFNFSLMKNLSQLWFIQNLKETNKSLIHKQIQKNKLNSFKQKQLFVLNMLKHKIDEDCPALRQRSWKIKQLMQNIKQKHNQILVVSHYYIIQYVNATHFNQHTHAPAQEIDFQNCCPYCNCVEEIIKHK